MLYEQGAALDGVTLRAGAAGAGSAAGVNIRWLVTDQLGTPRMVAERTGSLAGVTRHDYLPFGEELPGDATWHTPARGYKGDTVRQKLTGYERDAEVGLDYAQARYFSSGQGRFTSADPLFIDARRLPDPQLLNIYTYARNNPLKYNDPTGLDVTLEGTQQKEYINAINNRDKHASPSQASIAR